jgi:hypothetical protein
LTADELADAIDETLPPAVRNASYEAFEGIHEADKLMEMVDEEAIKQLAIDLIANYKLPGKDGR